MVVPLVAIPVVTVPAISRATAVVVMAPVTTTPIVMVPSIVPLPFIMMVLFPLPTVPITMPVVIAVSIPSRTDDNSSRRFDVHRWRRCVDRLGCIRDTRDANVDSNIDMRESDGRYANAKAGDECHREPAAT
ncbi:hypothetical protein AYM40_35320 [Paraburkholderia phytofirmans OLGA172]|uniref:Uncharacterized protein n=1 Tax=Paraburkholderia phytofirmans OLGA172 TaxID=1417228 RepID=A0A160FWK1_9BURK|nr:hypothetical protein AYM40_35320 [Paraburkholderia phytofirmans OLGA172]